MVSQLVFIAIIRSMVFEYVSDWLFVTISAISSTNSATLMNAFQHFVLVFEIMKGFYCFQFKLHDSLQIANFHNTRILMSVIPQLLIQIRSQEKSPLQS